VLVTGGNIKCWGDNSKGQLGDGSMIQQNSPVDVNLGSGVYYHDAPCNTVERKPDIQTRGNPR
jgi:hypothetical protein